MFLYFIPFFFFAFFLFLLSLYVCNGGPVLGMQDS
jgi:hypothetical protein